MLDNVNSFSFAVSAGFGSAEGELLLIISATATTASRVYRLSKAAVNDAAAGAVGMFEIGAMIDVPPHSRPHTRLATSRMNDYLCAAMPDSSPSRLSWKLIFLLIVLAVLGTGAWIYWRIETAPQRITRDVLRAFREVSGVAPRITVHDRVVFEQTKDALELAVVTRETAVEREMEHEWLGSKKRIRLRGTYVVKAGFDLHEHLAVRIDGRRIRIELPPPKILSVDPRDTEVLAFENGLWNKIEPADLEAELRALPALARKKAVQTGLPGEAVETFQKRLRDQFAPNYEVEFTEPAMPLP